MATVDLATRLGSGLHPSRQGNTNVPYLVDMELDWAVAADEKGSALAAADVIECIDVPAGTLVIAAGIEVLEAATGASSDVAVDLGVTGVDADVFVDSFDLDAAAAGAYAQQPAAYQPVVIGSAADTVDVLIQAATTAPTGGSIRVWAVLQDLTQLKRPGRAALGS